MTDYFLQVFKDCFAEELSKTVLSDDEKVNLTREVTACYEVGSAAQSLLKNRIISDWVRLFKKGSITFEDITELKYNRIVTENIISSCKLAIRVFWVWINVHRETYNRLIHDTIHGM